MSCAAYVEIVGEAQGRRRKPLVGFVWYQMPGALARRGGRVSASCQFEVSSCRVEERVIGLKS